MAAEGVKAAGHLVKRLHFFEELSIVYGPLHFMENQFTGLEL